MDTKISCDSPLPDLHAPLMHAHPSSLDSSVKLPATPWACSASAGDHSCGSCHMQQPNCCPLPAEFHVSDLILWCWLLPFTPSPSSATSHLPTGNRGEDCEASICQKSIKAWTPLSSKPGFAPGLCLYLRRWPRASQITSIQLIIKGGVITVSHWVTMMTKWDKLLLEHLAQYLDSTDVQ